MPAAAAFETVGTTHIQQAAQMASTAANTSGSYLGAAGAAMAGTAGAQSGWIGAAGAFAQKTAKTVESGMGMYSGAVAATVPFGQVVANRVRVATLHATNILGVNTIPIAEGEAEYVEYWGQNASAMMSYLSGITGLVGSLAAPLPMFPGMSNPAAATAAGIAASGMSLGLQGAGAALSQATQAGTGAAAAGTGVATTGASAAATAGGQAASQAGQSGPIGGGLPGAGSPAAPGNQPADAGQVLQSAQGMMGPMMSAPAMAAGNVGQLLSQAQQLPSSLGGQLGGLISPVMSAAGGFGGGGSPAAGLSGLTSAGTTPWSGLSSASGGYAGGGSAVSAALTKPSAAPGGIPGPVGVPQSWWNNTSTSDKPLAGPRAEGAATARGMGAPMGPGMFGMPAAAGAGNGRRNRDVADPDKDVLVDEGSGQAVPVYTDEGDVVYVQGQEV
ncbi:hypothetical protein AFM11_30280 [Mycolicibacterium wolinskyi]|uniref:PPE domain-containing protein n=1 Tax=Mycolicibacterium wolinskyi TaxID=59750 RepID=A0A132PDR0_9MYCO|nr:hypothetical protein AFM11_30280 [Mycolicibacterium wolinskyi]